jgi:LmbE family N-acetylglucosaminyl deacetylase
MAMATRIAFETRAGRPIHCVTLTNGAAGGASPAVRDAESLAVLTKLGVHPDAICFLGSRHGIQDGTLVRFLEHSLALVDEHLGAMAIDQVFCLAWEGGHPDHDASHLVALALSQRRRLLGRIWQFPLYHGRGTPDGLFRVMAPLDARGCLKRRIALRDGVRIALLSMRYRSQRSTWLGLFPEALVKLVLLRRELMQEATPEAVLRKPHPGKLFYERRFGVDYESWRVLAEPFIRRHLGPAGQ